MKNDQTPIYTVVLDLKFDRSERLLHIVLRRFWMGMVLGRLTYYPTIRVFS